MGVYENIYTFLLNLLWKNFSKMDLKKKKIE